MEEAFYSGILVIISILFHTRIISQGFIFREPFLPPGAVSPVLISHLPEASNPAAWLVAPDGRYEFPLMPMGVLADGSHIQSFGTLRQILKIATFSTHKSHSAGGRGVPKLFCWLEFYFCEPIQYHTTTFRNAPLFLPNITYLFL